MIRLGKQDQAGSLSGKSQTVVVAEESDIITTIQRRKKIEGVVLAALVTAGGAVVVALITAMSPPFQELWKSKLMAPPKTTPANDGRPDLPKKKTKKGYCQVDPVTKVKYTCRTSRHSIHTTTW